MKLRPRPNVLIHLKTTIFKQENDLNIENNKKKYKKIKKKTAMMKNCTICSVSNFNAQRIFRKFKDRFLWLKKGHFRHFSPKNPFFYFDPKNQIHPL